MRALCVGMLALLIAVGVAGCKGKTEGKKKVVPMTPPAGAVVEPTSPAGAVVEPTSPAGAAVEPTSPAAAAEVATEPATAAPKAVDEQLKETAKPEEPESK